MDITVTSEALKTMRGHARAAHPHECCGILFGSAGRIDEAVPAANVHPQPATRFEIDPQALIDAHRMERKGGARVAGYYHSHPAGPARPSAIDRAQSTRDGAIWAIVAGDSVTFWRAELGELVELSCTEEPG